VAALAGLAACGGGADEAVVARVGSEAITKGALLHWTQLLATERSLAERSAQRQALEFLTSAGWLTGEATAERLMPSAHEVQRQIGADQSSPAVELRESTGPKSRTAADLRLEAAAQLAAMKLSRRVVEAVPQVTSAEIRSYYRRHRRDFVMPERRSFEIDNLHSPAAAQAAKREVESGRSFATIALREELSSVLGPNPGRHAIERAIFASKPGVLGGPVLLADVGDHSLYEVTRIFPAHYEPLDQASASIASRLDQQRQRRARASFASAWSARWTARTSCAAGYVVPTCREYRGSEKPQAALGLG